MFDSESSNKLVLFSLDFSFESKIFCMGLWIGGLCFCRFDWL